MGCEKIYMGRPSILGGILKLSGRVDKTMFVPLGYSNDDVPRRRGMVLSKCQRENVMIIMTLSEQIFENIMIFSDKKILDYRSQST